MATPICDPCAPYGPLSDGEIQKVALVCDLSAGAVNAPNLQTNDQLLTFGQSLSIPTLTVHSISIYVAVGTADINGVPMPTGFSRNIVGINGANNIETVQLIDNVSATGEIFVTTTVYV